MTDTVHISEFRRLQTKIELLEKENSRLKALLSKYGQKIPSSKEKFASCDDIHTNSELTINDARNFFSYFWGRMDVYSKRVENKKTGKVGYFPQCNNFWKFGLCPKADRAKIACKDCKHRDWTKLTPDKIIEHLQGKNPNASDVIGIYPLFPDGTTRFLVFDFDNHESDGIGESETDNCKWQEEISALRYVCHKNNIPILVERSRSGNGAHLWIFFESPVEASVARNFGAALLDKGAEFINIKNFKYYDRMLPAQDFLPKGGLGNLIALPLQGLALKEGNSAFVDKNWHAYKNQWEALLATKKLSKQQLLEYVAKWNVTTDLDMSDKNTAIHEKPWEKEQRLNSNDVSGTLNITLANGIYIETAGLKPRLQNQIRRMAAFTNPAYFKNISMNISNYGTPRHIYLGEDYTEYISIPRGLFDTLISKCQSAGIQYRVNDQRSLGRQIDVTFTGELLERQKNAVAVMLSKDNGILSAATAFGKTVVSARLIAARKINTLILLESSVLLEQWEKSLLRFLNINEEFPKYVTKSGQEKCRKSLIGKIYGTHDSSTGIIDIAMVGSLCKKGEFHPKLQEYGMVIVDECHHAASETVSKILKEIKAKYVYGVSATPFREDGLEKANYMLLGPVRYKYTAKDIALEQGITRTVIPRFTKTVNTQDKGKTEIGQAYKVLCENVQRNKQITEDVVKCIEHNRNVVVLTKFKEHAAELFKQIKQYCKNSFLLTGDLSKKERIRLNETIEHLPIGEQLLLVATGQFIGEGFDCPRLDTLVLAMPIAWKGLVEQYAGRLNRDYAGKTDVVIYDYVDTNIPVFDKMYLKRLKAYKQIGYSLAADVFLTNQNANGIFDATDYLKAYNIDLQTVTKEIVISSPTVSYSSANSLLNAVRKNQENGLKITFITWHPESYIHGKDEHRIRLLENLYANGVNIMLTQGNCYKCAVMDNEIIWYGNINLLSKAGEEDNVMRIRSKEVACELLETIFNKEQHLVNYETLRTVLLQ